MIVAPERVSGSAWHCQTGRRRVTSDMDARGYCQDRLESSSTGDAQPAQRPPAAPDPPRRSSAPAPIPPSQHGHHLAHWPLRDTLVLEALVDAVPRARAHVRQLLRDWGRTEFCPDVSVVVSELVTNAVTASAEVQQAGALVLVWLGSHSHHLLLAVADTSPQVPVRLTVRADAEEGRGLALVEALSSRWGWYPSSITGLRKNVWAEWRVESRRTAAAEETRHGPSAPEPSRGHDVSALTDAELERIRRELQASLALARPGSPICVPILGQLHAIGTELAGRSADCDANESPGTSIRVSRPANPGRPR